jgi:O-antigen ligase
MIIFTSIAVFLFSAIALIVAGGYSFGAVMLFVGSAVLLWKRPALILKKDDYFLIGAFLFYFIIYSSSNIFHSDPGREYDAPLRFLLAIPVLLLLLTYPAKPAALWGGLAVGAIGAAVFVGWQYFVMGIDRPGGNTNAIHYGNVSMLLGILCLSGVTWARLQRRQVFWTALLFVGAVSGVLGSFFTGSRGGWIALPICAGIFIIHYCSSYGRRYFYSSIFILITFFVAISLVPKSPIMERIELAVHQVNIYFNGSSVDTSVGHRFEMWRTAIVMIPEKIWFGWGSQGYMKNKIYSIEKGKIMPEIAPYTNVHNEYIDSLVKHGIIGFLALISLYSIPFFLFFRHINNPNPNVRPYALAGVFLILSYILFGLTTTFLTINIGVMMLSFFVVIFWSNLREVQSSPNSV